MSCDDVYFMGRALMLARKGHPSPNPRVGAVVVKDGVIIGEGFHERAGMPHAEVNALKGIEAAGATLYVTLEPCSHHGRTPPCTDAIIDAGIGRVVCAMRDPNPKVDGIGLLTEAGIPVDVGIMEDEARRLNEAFISYLDTNRPFTVLKCGMSLDGKIATKTGASKWITSQASRERAREMRENYDAILVGIGTVLADDPSLRSSGDKHPLRIILDSTLRIPRTSDVLSDDNVLVVTTTRAEAGRREALEQEGIEVLVCGDETVDLVRLLSLLGERGVTSLLVEGGSTVHGSFVQAGLVDKVLFFIAPLLIPGSTSLTAVGGEGIERLEEALRLGTMKVRRYGDDILIEAYPVHRSV
jgi:diaminohydroxyphosphoribosylaminopyrimidine deaminase/5-amino-6-(5-phosphoribosylamino)uracil reductase